MKTPINMSTIVTVTFSPCIDKSTTIPALIPEKKLRCSAPTLEPGGGGINVARAIKILGGEATAIFPSGGYTGKFFNHLLELEAVTSVIISTRAETRENIIVLDESNHQQYRFGMPGTELLESEWQQCLKAVEDIHEISYIIASGSLPPGVPLNVYAMLAKIAKTKQARYIVDTSGAALAEAADEGVFLLKPNLGELSSLAGVKHIAPEEVAATGRSFIASGKCEAMVVSMGAAGAMLITAETTEKITPPHVARKSTVGAGDSMVAGITYYLSMQKPLLEAARYGVACGTAATMNPGTELCNKEDVDQIYARIQHS